MATPAHIKGLIQEIKDSTEEEARFGCEYTIEIDGMPECSFQMKIFGLPPMKYTEATEHVKGTEIPTRGVVQFGGSEGIPFTAKIRQKGETLRELHDHVFSGEWIPKIRVSLGGPGETPTANEIANIYKGRFQMDILTLEDDANTEVLTAEGTLYYMWWEAGE